MEILKYDHDSLSVDMCSTNMQMGADNCGNQLRIRCGDLSATLIKDQFMCPGIHSLCIQLNDEDTDALVTPKNFTDMAGKSSLKDWKTAIRINGRPLRKYMELGYLDFYEHNMRCTMRCFPRSVVSRDDLLDPHSPLALTGNHHLENNMLDDESEGEPPVAKRSRRKLSNPMQTISFRRYSQAIRDGVNPFSQHVDDDIHQFDMFSRQRDVNHNALKRNASFSLSKSHDEDVELARQKRVIRYEELTSVRLDNEDEPVVPPSDCTRKSDGALNSPGVADVSVSLDSPFFWQCIVDYGLIDEVFKDIIHSIRIFKLRLMNDAVEKTEAEQLSNIVGELKLMDRLRYKLSMKQKKLRQEGKSLEQEVEKLKRKVAIAEGRKLKLQNDTQRFSQLLRMSSNKDVIGQHSTSTAVRNWSVDETGGESRNRKGGSSMPSLYSGFLKNEPVTP
ncbi:uncharacterized protein LOC141909657 isoform X2 [Tubulanus polymorphus]|uniref:uncharacterized protein LOC141909657 isoform X2 n=1 Tax=Tubulanus polymorphus TaxID=672921 RepID=UPI003DA6045B